jgi:hypothetical protein
MSATPVWLCSTDTATLEAHMGKVMTHTLVMVGHMEDVCAVRERLCLLKATHARMVRIPH